MHSRVEFVYKKKMGKRIPMKIGLGLCHPAQGLCKVRNNSFGVCDGCGHSKRAFGVDGKEPKEVRNPCGYGQIIVCLVYVGVIGENKYPPFIGANIRFRARINDAIYGFYILALIGNLTINMVI